MIGGIMNRYQFFRVSIVAVFGGTSLVLPELAQHTVHVTPSTVQ